jgi:hypothetical protein
VDSTHFGVQLIAPLPIFGGLPQDQLIVRVGHDEAITLLRRLPANYGAVAEALAGGLAFSLNAHQPSADLLCLLSAGGWPGLPPTDPGARSPRVPFVRRLRALR